ncbi:uncharacterized protein [Leuresthes tenuis]|uniref:uncharacterized protein n=1 Tax=Leuresthes tenuis TaxID=355514 RepID=UPI003B508C77
MLTNPRYSRTESSLCDSRREQCFYLKQGQTFSTHSHITFAEVVFRIAYLDPSRMHAGDSTPYGVKCLQECMCRATLLAQPDDILGFLLTHVRNILKSRDGESKDIKEVVFQYQNQWEKTFLLEQCKQIETLKPSTEDSPASSIPAASSASLMVSGPIEVRQITGGESSYRLNSQKESRRPTAEEEGAPSSKPRPSQPATRVKTQRILSVRIPCRIETKPYLSSARPVLPPIQAPLQVQKKVRVQKSSKMPDGAYTCLLTDCPYHNKQSEGLESIKSNIGLRMKTDPGLQKSNTEQRPVDVPVPYRPKGGHIMDPELLPKRGRAAVCGRQACKGWGAVLEHTFCTNISQMSLESSVHTCPHMIHCAHIIRYKGMHAQCSGLQPHFGRRRYIAPQSHAEPHMAAAAASSASNTVAKKSSIVSPSPNLRPCLSKAESSGQYGT